MWWWKRSFSRRNENITLHLCFFLSEWDLGLKYKMPNFIFLQVSYSENDLGFCHSVQKHWKVHFMIREAAAAFKDFLKHLPGNMSFLLHGSWIHSFRLLQKVGHYHCLLFNTSFLDHMSEKGLWLMRGSSACFRTMGRVNYITVYVL